MKTDNKKVANNSGVLVKYGFLIALTTSFFLLVIALSSITFFTSQQFEKATREFDIASHQTVLAQQLSKNLLDTGVYARDLQTVARELQQKNQEVQATAQSGANAQSNPQPNVTNVQPSTQPVAQPNTAQTGIVSSNATQPTQTQPDNAPLTNNVPIPFAVVPQSAIYNLQELRNHAKIFTENLNAFKEGGTLKDASGQEIPVQAVTDEELKATLAKIDAIWTPYLGLLNNFSGDVEKGVISKQTSDFLTDYTRMYNSALQAETTAFAARKNEIIQSDIAKLRNAQVVGAVIAFLLFLGIVFGALQRLMRVDRQLAVAQRQTDDIMNTVNEGLFLIDKDLVIADQYSAKLEQILHKKDIAGRTLYDILEGMISQKDMDTTKLFVDQLYNTWVVEELIQDLNPLKQVLLSYMDESGISLTKFLEFNFLRVLDASNEAVENVFVSVTDITNEINLQNQMQKDKEQHNRQIEMISYLLSVDGAQLAYFMKETKARIERMNEILRHSDVDNLKEKAEQLYRETHSLKGDASAVNLGALVDIANKQEDRLRQLLQQTNLKGNDFLSFTVGLDEMVSMVSFIDGLLQRLNLQGLSGGQGFGQSFLTSENTPNQPAPTQKESAKNDAMAFSQSFDKPQPKFDFDDGVVVEEFDFNDTTPANKGYWQGYFEKYASDIAERQNKSIALTVTGFDTLPISDGRMSVYKDVAVQLLKNAIVHGIESKDDRIANGKEPIGDIRLSIGDDGDNQKLEIYDDGAGVNWEKIRQKAVEMGQYSEEESHKLVHKDLLRLMFNAGLSTAEKQDEDAGRGVGMDIVKQLASEYHAKIGINSRHAQFTKISITFPKEGWDRK